jgi:hypothetical protein
VLLVAILFTQIALQNYDGVSELSGNFVWPVAARNFWLLVYLILVCGPILAAGRRDPAEARRLQPPGRPRWAAQRSVLFRRFSAAG